MRPPGTLATLGAVWKCSPRCRHRVARPVFGTRVPQNAACQAAPCNPWLYTPFWLSGGFWPVRNLRLVKASGPPTCSLRLPLMVFACVQDPSKDRVSSRERTGRPLTWGLESGEILRMALATDQPPLWLPDYS